MNKRRLLIVDDEAPFRDLLTLFFEERGYQVLGLGDAESALDLVRRETVDAVLLDNNLPGMMGITALPQLRKLSPAPVIMITGHPSEETSRDALMLGAKALLPKPLDFDKLTALLNGLLG